MLGREVRRQHLLSLRGRAVTLPNVTKKRVDDVIYRASYFGELVLVRKMASWSSGETWGAGRVLLVIGEEWLFVPAHRNDRERGMSMLERPSRENRAGC
jgi:hypothetical protein